jgi:serine/threonine protein kinase
MSVRVLGPYEILGALGAGGMGEVFRARDTRLNREVAIKVLPKQFASDPDRLRRFEQETKTLASINHPNILTIYDVGMQEAPYLVSELLEGKTLREVLGDGALPLRKATDYALQIAQGLAAAHGKGIIHRDLKPENVFITKDGRVKILDFGLAKLQADFKSQISNLKSAGDEAPTLADSTRPGMVLGTPAYMSPEQVRGEPVDHRADIFAFGCVFYEMLTGTRAFRRDTPVQSMNAVLSEEPADLHTTNLQIPIPLERVVRRCLEKTPERRFQSASDLEFAIENAGTSSSTALAGTRMNSVDSRVRWKRVLPWATSVLLGLLLLISITFPTPTKDRAASTNGSTGPVNKVQLYLPGSGSVYARSTVAAAISPDGRKLAYVNDDGLWLYRLDRTTSASRLTSGHGLSSPFWSPDSEEIGYFGEDKLYRTTVDGARPTPICSHVRFESPHGEGAAWLPGNRIIFATGGSPLLETPASGGGEPVVRLTFGPDDLDFEEPCALPDGRGILFLVLRKQGHGIDVWMPNGQHKKLFTINAGFQQPVFSSSGHVIFWRLDQGNEGIWAFPFSLDRLERTGEPFLVSDVGRVPTASYTGTLAFALHESEFFGLRQLTWVDRSGKILGTVGEPLKGLIQQQISPDGRQVVAMAREGPNRSRIWLLDAVTGSTIPFSPEKTPGSFLNTAQWSADGRKIIFMRQNSDGFVLAAKPSDGSSEEQVLYRNMGISRSEQYLFAEDPQGGTNTHVHGYIQVSDPNRKFVPFPQAFQRIGPRLLLSPDNRLLAFDQEEGDKSDVYVVEFPSFKNRQLVSRGGGWYPVWKPDSRELFFLGENRGAMMSARLKPGTTDFEPPEKLFNLPRQIYNSAAASVYDVAPDGRFLMLMKVENASPEPGQGKANVEVVLNWFEEFRGKK